MTTTAVLCTDGSDLAQRAMAAGRSVLRRTDKVIVVTVVDEVDPMLAADGSGHAGATMSPEELRMLDRNHVAQSPEGGLSRIGGLFWQRRLGTAGHEPQPGNGIARFCGQIVE